MAITDNDKWNLAIKSNSWPRWPRHLLLAIKNAITLRTKAIIPVHLHCAVANMSEIIQIAKGNGLYVI